MKKRIVENAQIRNVYQTEDESIKRFGGGVTIGQMRDDPSVFSIHVSNPVMGMRAFIPVDREEMVSLRDALNKELAS